MKAMGKHEFTGTDNITHHNKNLCLPYEMNTRYYISRIYGNKPNGLQNMKNNLRSL